MASAPDPQYDVLGAFDMWAQGVVLQRPILDALEAQYAANGFTPLTEAQVIAIAGPLPPYPTSLPRFPDSNPLPRDA